MMNINFIGLGHLGLPLACCLSSGGHKILGIDKNEELIEKLKNNILPFYEPELDKYFKDNTIEFTSKYNKTGESSVSIILVDTQDPDGGYSDKKLLKVIDELLIYIKEDHLIIISSTVMPGVIVNLKEKNKNIRFAYVPDFVALGTVIKDFTNPDFFLIGAEREKTFMQVRKIFYKIHQNNPTIKELTIEEAEISKMSLNAYIVTKITFVNFLFLLCKDIPNVDIHNITATLSLDKRISKYFFSAGPPYGGKCFPRDVMAFMEFSKSKNKEAKHLKFTEETNQMMYSYLIDELKKYKKVGILGLSFKPNFSEYVCSPSSVVIKELCKENLIINVNDRLIKKDIEHTKMYIDTQKCIDNSEIVVLMHKDEYFKQFDYSRVKVIDLWNNELTNLK